MLKSYAPIFLLFALGVLLRQSAFMAPDFGKRVLKLVFYFTLPAFILDNMNRLQLRVDDFLLVMAVVPVFLFGGALAWWRAAALTENPARQGPMVLGVMIMNLAFIFPFIYIAHGAEGVIPLVLINTGNGILTMTVGYFTAVWFGRGRFHAREVLRSFGRAVPLQAVLLSTIFQLFHIRIPEIVTPGIHVLGVSGLPLVVLALGFLFQPARLNYRLVIPPVLLRLGVGIVSALFIKLILPEPSVVRHVLFLSVLAPCGFNTVTFSVVEHLDASLAAGIVSWSTLMALLYVPFV